MEAESGREADGGHAGRRAEPQPNPQPHPPADPPPDSHRGHPRARPHHPQRSQRGGLLLRLQQQQAVGWRHSDSFLSPLPSPSSSSSSPIPPSPSSTSPSPSSTSVAAQDVPEAGGGPSSLSRRGGGGGGEKKPQKPGRYVCSYCGRPCAKPSVLQKHIRSHTGERPYPCGPCGFSFKTKSNLYKHRKSHAHRVKAGLAAGLPLRGCGRPAGDAGRAGDEDDEDDPEEPTEGETTDSEEETGQRRGGKGEPLPAGRVEEEEEQRTGDSQAVKQRLAMRLSERKRGPAVGAAACPDDPRSSLSTSTSSSSSTSLGRGSKGSTESGYFSGSGSTELAQASPPSASAKSYAEIILGKYGRLGGQQRSSHHTQPSSSSSSSEKGPAPFTVPKTQVIEHITKLITINEAVVDTSEIDSVKPRRSSLSRKGSVELPKFASKDPMMAGMEVLPGPSGLGRLLLLPHGPAGAAAIPPGASGVPLLRSHSVPSPATQEGEPSAGLATKVVAAPPGGFRLSRSFDEQQAAVAEMRGAHAQRMLRRQPAIELPPGAEQSPDEAVPRVGHQGEPRETLPRCPGRPTPAPLAVERRGDAREGTGREDRPQIMHYKFRALAMAVRKRRKEESLEEDPPSPGPTSTTGCSVGFTPLAAEHGQPGLGGAFKPEPHNPPQERKGVSVIQHTSSFEKQESVSMESQGADPRESRPAARQHPEPKPSPSTSRLIRQHNIQVPEILVTVEPDADMTSVSPPATTTLSKETERVEEFQWPQRSQSLAQLPAEKLPPKKKRLRLAEMAAQSSGESSFESVASSSATSLPPRSPVGGESEDTPTPSTSTSGGQGCQRLAVPHLEHHPAGIVKEMRRSASEQAPASRQADKAAAEARSKSFDCGSLLSPRRPTCAWRERRKCLLVRHATLGEPEQEDVGTGVGKPSQSQPQGFPPGLAVELLLPLTPAFSVRTAGPPSPLRNIHHLPPPPLPSRPTASQAAALSCGPRPPGRHLSVEPFALQPLYSGPFPRCTLVTTCLARITPVLTLPLAVPVRLHAHVPSYARAMYTTLSQILAPSHHHHHTHGHSSAVTAMVLVGRLERDSLRRSLLEVPFQEVKSFLPLPLRGGEPSSGEGEDSYGPLGAGGSKRMLSPAASLELSTEARRHQKRVKEEGGAGAGEEQKLEAGLKAELGQEEGNEVKLEEGARTEPERVEDVPVKTEGEGGGGGKLEQGEEGEGESPEAATKPIKGEAPGVQSPGSPGGGAPSWSSLHTATAVSWCYLSYTKPTPCAGGGDPRASAYATWSVGAHNPNLPGLSTKVALSLLCTKQRCGSQLYTVAASAPAPAPATGNMASSSRGTPRVSEVHATPTGGTVELKDPPRHEIEEKKKKGRVEEEGPSTSKSDPPPRVRIFEGGYKSNEEYVYVRGRGRGKYVCGECGIRCKKPSMLRKHIRTHTDVRPYVCKHCNFAFKTKGNLTKHMKSKAHGKKCQAMGVSESSWDEPESEEPGGSEEQLCGSEEKEEQEEHQFSDVEESSDDEEDEEEEEEQEEEQQHEEEEGSSSLDDPPSSSPCSSDTGLSLGGRPDSGLPRLGGRTSSPCSRRALFLRQGRGVALSPRAGGGESRSPSHSLSPRPEQLRPSPPTTLSPLQQRARAIAPLPPSPQCRPPPLHMPWEVAGGTLERNGTVGDAVPMSPEAIQFPPFLRLSSCEGYPGHQGADSIFSHLPLHSRQAKVPYLMIPIGGIQMVQARVRSHLTTPRSPTFPPSTEGPLSSASPGARFDLPWGGTPSAQGLRTTGDSLGCGRQDAGAAAGVVGADSKQYGSSAHSQRHVAEGDARDFPSGPPLGSSGADDLARDWMAP